MLMCHLFQHQSLEINRDANVYRVLLFFLDHISDYDADTNYPMLTDKLVREMERKRKI